MYVPEPSGRTRRDLQLEINQLVSIQNQLDLHRAIQSQNFMPTVHCQVIPPSGRQLQIKDLDRSIMNHYASKRVDRIKYLTDEDLIERLIRLTQSNEHRVLRSGVRPKLNQRVLRAD